MVDHLHRDHDQDEIADFIDGIMKVYPGRYKNGE